MCFLHKWGKWQQYDRPSPERILSSNWRLSSAVEHRQKKRCQRCGKVKDVKIGMTVKG